MITMMMMVVVIDVIVPKNFLIFSLVLPKFFLSYS